MEEKSQVACAAWSQSRGMRRCRQSFDRHVLRRFALAAALIVIAGDHAREAWVTGCSTHLFRFARMPLECPGHEAARHVAMRCKRADLPDEPELLDEKDYIALFRANLEEQHTREVLRRKPRFLPFKDCVRWVQAMGLWNTEAEWREWIANGEKRNAYIPSQPDKYYGDLGQWRGWAYFLHGKSTRAAES
mmetsp:Transcript_53449/g.98861  ORF Transcript_53449/g.98861 Transcript_53449/m.98861 type:complete len:190 (-) Transcript_53449:123-692(-)